MKQLKLISSFLLVLPSLICGETFVVPTGLIPRHNEEVVASRLSSFPYLSGDTFRAACDFCIDERQIPFDPEMINDGDTIFLSGYALYFFFLVIHPKIKKHYILVTHNPDHAYFVRHHEKPSISVPMYAPEKYDNAQIDVMHKLFKIKNYKITPIPTVHSIKVKSNAYLIEHEKKRLLYTGDMIWIDKRYQTKLGILDLVITEASFMRAGGMVRKKDEKIFGHTGVPNLIHLFKKHTNKILFMHFGAWFYKNIQKARKDFKQLAREYN
jgi:hypothetical protein